MHGNRTRAGNYEATWNSFAVRGRTRSRHRIPTDTTTEGPTPWILPRPERIRTAVEGKPEKTCQGCWRQQPANGSLKKPSTQQQVGGRDERKDRGSVACAHQAQKTALRIRSPPRRAPAGRMARTKRLHGADEPAEVNCDRSPTAQLAAREVEVIRRTARSGITTSRSTSREPTRIASWSRRRQIAQSVCTITTATGRQRRQNPTGDVLNFSLYYPVRHEVHGRDPSRPQ